MKIKWNQAGNGNVHVSDEREGYWATFPASVTAQDVLDAYMATADYSAATATFFVTATVLDGENANDVARTVVVPKH